MQKLQDQSMAGELEEQPAGQGGWGEGCEGERRRRERSGQGAAFPSHLRGQDRKEASFYLPMYSSGNSTSVRKGITWGHRSRS